MGFRGYRTTAKPEQINRPPAVGLVSVAGVLSSFTLFGLAVALLYIRTSQGLSLTDQAADIGVAVAVALLLVWVYWGTWDLFPSSWWTHMILGPILIIGLLALIGFAPQAAKIVAHDMLSSEIAQAELVIRFGAIILALLGARKAFSIGVKKPLWE